jgi:hypothetical protein
VSDGQDALDRGDRSAAGAPAGDSARAAGTAGGPKDGGEPARDRGAQGVATALAEISDRATRLIHEEIELAKAEVVEKLATLARGAAVGVAAGIFVVTALFFVLIGCAWLLYYYLPIGTAFTYFVGFFAMALILLILGLVAGLVAARVVRRGSPPTPDMAIEEARRIRETVTAPETVTGPETVSGAGTVTAPESVSLGGEARRGDAS